MHISNVTSLQNLSKDERKKVTSLSFTKENLSTLPKEILDCTNVESINLSYNNLENIDALFNLPKLTKLLVLHNKLHTLHISSCPTLEVLYLSNNPITHVTFDVLDNIKEIALAYTSLTTLDVSMLKSLQVLVANNNPFTDFTKLPLNGNLQSLRLDSCKFEILKDLILPNSLTELYLDHNNLSTLSFSQAVNLKKLSIKHNKLQNFRGIGELPSLTYLYINHNQINNMLDFTGYPTLQILLLSHNPLLSLPNLSKLVNLRDLDISMTPLTTFKNMQTLPALRLLIAQGVHFHNNEDIKAYQKSHPQTKVTYVIPHTITEEM